MGYHQAGFEVVGVDHMPQKRYPFEFIQEDALEYLAAHGYEYDVIHASPPCQAYSVTKSLHDNEHPDLVGPTRELLQAVSKPYVIENVPGAPLINPMQLCGSSFWLRVRKHRLFESTVFMLAPQCQHDWQNADKIYTIRNHGKDRPSGVCYVFGNGSGKGDDWASAMGIDWMTRRELAQAIPPAYTEYIGRQLLEQLGGASDDV
jgi:DNA (cytosine-5)-methyltransferase 1